MSWTLSDSPSDPLEVSRERRVLAILEAVLDVEREERTVLLERECGGDRELRSRVEALLAAGTASVSFLEGSLGDGIRRAGDALEAAIDVRPEFVRLLGESFGESPRGPEGDEACGDLPLDLEQLARGATRFAGREEIARGGMGVIFRIWDRILRRPLAMKVRLPRGQQGVTHPGDSVDLARFLEEAQITGQLDHPGVVPLHDIGLDDEGRVFFTMRLVNGIDLSTVFSLARHERDGWNPTRALGAIVKVCETLAYAHSKGVIHRDIKPGNVMVGRYGETYVMDWGLAKVLGRPDARDLRIREPSNGSHTGVRTSRTEAAESPESPLLTMDGAVVGTPSFMPPEQAEGRVAELDGRSDVYAVGAMLYMLLAGSMPYTQPGATTSPRAVLDAVRRGTPVPVHRLAPDAPGELVAICEKAMARSPAARYATMDELAEDLRAYLENRVVRAHRVGPIVEFRKWVARNRATATSLAAVFLLLIAGLLVSLLLVRRIGKEMHAKEEALGQVEEEATAKSAALVEKENALERAEAMRLSAQSAAVRDTDPGQALFMAIEAARLVPGYRAHSALLAALDRLREERTLLGHSVEVTGVGFSPDQELVVTAARDATVRIWDSRSGEELLRLWGHTGGVNGVTYDPSGRTIASFAWDGNTRLWDAETGRLLHVLQHPGVVDHAVFSPDGFRMLTVCRDGKGRIWSVAQGEVEPHGTLVGHAPVELPWGSFAPDGERVVTASHDGTARIWDVSSGQVLGILAGHQAPLVSAEFSRDGRFVVTASADNTARVWDAEDGRERVALVGHERWLSGAVFSPDGERILTASVDRTARLWDAGSGSAIAILRGHDDAVHSARFGPGGKRILTCSADRTARIWDAASGKELAVLRGHQGAVLAAEFSGDGRRAITGSKDNTARLWDATTDAALGRLSRPAWDRQTVFSPDHSRVVVLASGTVAEVRGAASGELEAALAGHAGGIQAAAFSPDGTRLATASLDGTARLWDVESGRELAVLAAHEGAVVSVGFSPDGATVASASTDYTAA